MSDSIETGKINTGYPSLLPFKPDYSERVINQLSPVEQKPLMSIRSAIICSILTIPLCAAAGGAIGYLLNN